MAAASSAPHLLFGLRNNFYFSAYQAAIKQQRRSYQETVISSLKELLEDVAMAYGE